MTQLSRHPASGDSTTSMTWRLLGLHQRLREAVANGVPDVGCAVENPSGELNPKGDVRQSFDLIADELIHRELKTFCTSGVVLSEERAEVHPFGPPRQPVHFRVAATDGPFPRQFPAGGWTTVTAGLLASDSNVRGAPRLPKAF